MRYLLIMLFLIGCKQFHPTQPEDNLPYGECYVGYHWDSELEDCVLNIAEIGVTE